MPVAKFYLSKFAGKLVFEKPEQRDAFIKGMKPNVRYVETLGKYVKKRSHPQNRYYWAVVVKLIADHVGEDSESTHDGLRQKFLRVEHEILPTFKSTAKLTTVEFNAYVEQIVIWAAEFLEVVIPDPYSIDY